VHDTILLSSDPVSETSESSVSASRSKHISRAAPTRRHGEDYARSSGQAHSQISYGHQMPFNTFVRPQLHPMFFARPPPQFPAGHGMFKPSVALPHIRSQIRPAVASAHHGFSHYPVPVIPMFAQPNYQPYRPIFPTYFPPDSWIPMPNFPVQNGMRSPFRRS
jgi:hypothetical protein